MSTTEVCWLLTFVIPIAFGMGLYFGRATVRQYETEFEVWLNESGGFHITTRPVLVERDDKGGKVTSCA